MPAAPLPPRDTEIFEIDYIPTGRTRIRTTGLFDDFVEPAILAPIRTSKFTWEKWSNMWEKIALAHEKKVYCIHDEPACEESDSDAPQPTSPPTFAPVYTYTYTPSST